MRQAFEKEMIDYGYEPEELVPDDETGAYRDDELRAMWVGFQIGRESGALAFKDMMTKATSALFRPHIEGVYAVFTNRGVPSDDQL